MINVMSPYKVICRLKTGKIKKYEVDGVSSVQAARQFVIDQIKDTQVVLALVNECKPKKQITNGGPSPLKSA